MQASSIIASALAGALLLAGDAPLCAQSATPWDVKPKLLGKEKHGDTKKSKDVSGIACAEPSGFPRHCLVIDDNLTAAQLVTMDDGRLEGGDAVPLIDGPLELDGEGVAFADGIFYVMGSHGIPRRPKSAEEVRARLAAASRIVRLRRAPDGTLSPLPSLSLTAAIAAQPELQRASTSVPLDRNGLTIEGIAVLGDRLFAGFRGPVLKDARGSDRAAILSVSLKGLAGHGALDPHLFRVPLGPGTGIRDMAVDGDRILLLAGPMRDGPGRYAIDLWDGFSDDGVRPLLALSDAGIDPGWKAEALLVLDATPRGPRVLVLFDGQKNGAPIALTLSGR